MAMGGGVVELGAEAVNGRKGRWWITMQIV